MEIFHLGRLWKSIQCSLFPELEDMVGELSQKDRNFIQTCELCADEMEKEMTAYERKRMGRPPAERMAIAKAFIAKAVYGMPTTEGLIAYLNASPTLRRLCGWESVGGVPSEPTFSRVFKVFAESKLPEHIHEAMVKKAYARKLVGHISRDATAIEARERAHKGKNEKSAKLTPGKKKGVHAVMNSVRQRRPNAWHCRAAGHWLRIWRICRMDATGAVNATATGRKWLGRAINCMWTWRMATFRSARC